jgi:hypothetical protein
VNEINLLLSRFHAIKIIAGKIRGLSMDESGLSALMATPPHWYVVEDEHTWCLFYGPETGMALDYQIIKAPKKDTPYAEYWPTPEQTRFIVDALNRAEKERGELQEKKTT